MKVLVAYKRSAWELFSNSRDPRVAAFMSDDNRDTRVFRRSHEIQSQALESVRAGLDAAGADAVLVDRSQLSDQKLDDIELAISVGGDGTFLDTSHYLRGIPMLGVNSDPERSVGFFSACFGPDFPTLFDRLGDLPTTRLTRAAILIDGETAGPPVLNDILFANPNPAGTTRYQIGDERFRNSGLLACTAAGSTAWMFQEGGEPMALEDRRLQLYHRGTRACHPEFADSLKIESLTRRGQLFIDGEHLSLPLSIGQSLEILSGEPLDVIGDLGRKRQEFLNRYKT